METLVGITGEWELLTNTSVRLLQELSNMLIETTYVNDTKLWGIFENIDEIQETCQSKMKNERRKMITELREFLKKYRDILNTMRKIKSGLTDLIDKSSMKPGNEPSILLDAEYLVCEWLDMLLADFNCKEGIVEDINELSESDFTFNSSTRDNLRIYLDVWLLQPLLDKERIQQLENMILSIVNNNEK